MRNKVKQDRKTTKAKLCTIVRLEFASNEEYDKATFKINFERHLPVKFVKGLNKITNLL